MQTPPRRTTPPPSLVAPVSDRAGPSDRAPAGPAWSALRPSRPPPSSSEGAPRSSETWAPSSSERPSRPSTRPPTATGERSWYLDLPSPPGEGTFRIKGIAYRGLAHLVTSRVEGGTSAFAAALPTPALQAFFGQPFLASSFYDVYPLVAGSGVLASLARTPIDTFAQQQGRAQAAYDVEHAYRALLQGKSSDDMHSRLRPLAGRYYDFGEWDVERQGPGRIRIVERNLPVWIMPWFVPMQLGYFSGLMAAMGKPGSTVTMQSFRREGLAGVMPLVVLELEVLLRD
ncbi:hypothetical protein [Polyangium spumosum]|uniref:DUF2378 family protein n=1 Tax=Polyangium spumosum TaxID=889282 RepID=A0A6N7PWG0_9BACT|nr:hypothetical protein [Polyangium spumosum]MRG96333.1 hypothetical protein [Polyangium spumosum]